ncbi:MFS transporter [Streptomyces sp. NBC_01214]|uniref:MFS transporter n=1 Tax=Streptomyces sp. NBC_01214 TaxID=2903777 RepID=UPI00225B3100|nr:MFS transporter [Streptomyces sp. NBC_01214]MCX4804385.1 MFS transporter [Streptomyces sp. NBC_01214]
MPTNTPQNLRTSTRPPRNRAITLLAVGHACVDVYQGAVAALIPFFVAERAYTYAAASGIVLAASLLSSVAQPLFGALTDRKPLPWLLPVSTLVGGLGIALSGLGDSYALTLLFVAVSGIGVAAYHPESARIARTASRGSHTAMSWFSLGGNLGFAFSPALVALVVGFGGLTMSPLLLLPALAGSVLCLPALRIVQQGQDITPGTAHRTLAPTPADDRRSFLRLTLGVICRSVVFIGLSTFISLHMAQSTGWGPTAGTAALVVLYLGGAIGTVLGGRLAERWDRVTVIRRSYLLTVLAVAGVALAPGPLGYPFVALASAGLYVPFSLQVTLAQDYLPNHVGTAGGITLGLTVSVGGIAAPAIGLLADATSLRTALIPLIAMPALSWLAFRGLPEPAATIGPAHRTTPVDPPSEKAESP